MKPKRRKIRSRAARLKALAAACALLVVTLRGVAAPGAAHFTATCHSFSVLPGQNTQSAVAARTTSFARYDGVFEFPPSGYNHEFAPSWGGEPGVYAADYAVHDSESNLVEHGIVSVELPALDADENGLPDILQLNQPGTASLTGTWVRMAPNQQLGSLKGTIVRNAGDATGSYSFSISNEFGSTTITGALRLFLISGPATFTRGGSNSFCVAADWTDIQGEITNLLACCSDECFSVDNVNVVRMAQLSFWDESTQRGITFAPVFIRAGHLYRARETFDWEDAYSEWTLEVAAPTDSDTNGIPDFSDFVPGAPYIVRQPANLITVDGANAFLSLEARGSELLEYQWFFNHIALSGATNPVLSLSFVSSNVAGTYFVRVKNTAGTIDSRETTVKVFQPFVGPLEMEWALRGFMPVNKLIVDGQGNLVAGGTVKISPAGETISSASGFAGEFVVDGADNAYVTHSSGNGIQTTKYDPFGKLIWSKATDSPATAVGIGLDGVAGNVYVAGWIGAGGPSAGYVLLKYNPEGKLEWTRTYVPECLDQGLLALAVDRSGATYIAGWGALLKHDQAGNRLWTHACTNYWPLKVKLDTVGNLIIGLSLFGNGYGIAKHGPDGERYWELRFTNGLSLVEMALDASNYVYVANSAGQLLKVHPDGHVVWTGRGGGILAIDAAGAVYSAGTVQQDTPPRNTDIFTQKVGGEGTNIWSALYGGADTDTPRSITVDADGSVYVGGILARFYSVVLKYIQPAMGASIRPMRQAADAGSTVAFNGFFRGSPPVTYQWQFQGTVIVGATSATLILENVHEDDAGEYTVVITDGMGNKTSATGRLMILEPQPAHFRFDSSEWLLEAGQGAYWFEVSADLNEWTKYQMVQHVSRTYIDLPRSLYPQLFLRARQRR